MDDHSLSQAMLNSKGQRLKGRPEVWWIDGEKSLVSVVQVSALRWQRHEVWVIKGDGDL